VYLLLGSKLTIPEKIWPAYFGSHLVLLEVAEWSGEISLPGLSGTDSTLVSLSAGCALCSHSEKRSFADAELSSFEEASSPPDSDKRCWEVRPLSVTLSLSYLLL
jgi:hypothetical protein